MNPDVLIGSHWNKMAGGVALRIGSKGNNSENFPSNVLPKGLVLLSGDEELCEEGVGFGVPVLKKRLETVFPGSFRIRSGAVDHAAFGIEFDMNRVARLSLEKSGSLIGGFLNSVKELTATMHRKLPFTRRPLNAVSNLMRALLTIKTTFIPAPSAGTVLVEFGFRPGDGVLEVMVDARGLNRVGATELVMMNELGARHFPTYVDSTGLRLRGNAIGTWNEVSAREASFISPRRGVGFTVRQLPGCRLFRGRELIPGRLSWSGLAYALPPETERFRYTIRIGEMR
jgi:hypothetical protein